MLSNTNHNVEKQQQLTKQYTWWQVITFHETLFVVVCKSTLSYIKVERYWLDKYTKNNTSK